MKDVFTSADRELLNRVAALLDRGAPSSQHSPATPQLRTTVFQTHAFTAGLPVHFAGTTWQKSLASNDDPALLPVGLVELVGIDKGFTVVLSGLIRGLSGLTAGSVYYLASAGGLTVTASPINRIPVLLALSATTGLVLCNDRSLVWRRVGYSKNTGVSGTTAKVSFQDLAGTIPKHIVHGPFRCDFSAWATDGSGSNLRERHILGNALVQWDSGLNTWEISYHALGVGPISAIVAPGAPYHTASLSAPVTSDGMTLTLSLNGGAGGAYSALLDVTATLSNLPAGLASSGVSLSVDGPGLVRSERGSP